MFPSLSPQGPREIQDTHPLQWICYNVWWQDCSDVSEYVFRQKFLSKSRVMTQTANINGYSSAWTGTQIQVSESQLCLYCFLDFCQWWHSTPVRLVRLERTGLCQRQVLLLCQPPQLLPFISITWLESSRALKCWCLWTSIISKNGFLWGLI